MSLLRISLRDFVIVRQLDLDFSQGFGVLSGETGAGKSILVDALQLVLGARAEASVVREGASRTEISAEFGLTKAHVGFSQLKRLLLRGGRLLRIADLLNGRLQDIAEVDTVG